MKLLTEINERMKEVGILTKDRIAIYDFLKVLKEKDSETYKHSIRVALLASRAADILNIDSKALLIAGCLHDIGKSKIDSYLLNKEDFNEKDMEDIKNHSIFSYDILVKRFGFTADIVVRHHYWQEAGYPSSLPDFNVKYSQKTRDKINYYSKILALVDFYDAITTRKNNKYIEKSPEKIKLIILEKNKDMTEIIEQLYNSGIFI